ncbi:MAG: Gfo/Idh/MocA family oxidoreductase [Planctomycetota bacterium]|nr:Gfo/Idh/MocA family oxidoreductase [Planctomycetota bacterium]
MQTGQGITRRGLLKGAGAALAAPYVITSFALGAEGRLPPSGRIAMGFIGLGTQGGGHLVGGAWTYLTGGYLARDDVQVLAVCDIVRAKRESYQQRVNAYYAEKSGQGASAACQAYNDFRDVLARPDVDAVLIATPVHWHALMSILAAQAGKDVYCEKPVSLTLREGRAMAEAVRRYGRVFQAGTQQRSCYGGKFRRACELVRSGRLGQLKSVYAMLGGGGFSPGPGLAAKGQPVPDGLDWDLFVGPAPWTPYAGSTDAHMFGRGSINWGQHHYDIVQWGIGADDTGPVEIGWEDGKLALRYASGVVVYGCPYPGEKVGGQGGAIFVGTEGRLAVDRDWLVSYPPQVLQQPPGPADVHLYKSNDHSGNFLDCIRSRKPAICDAETAHRAMSVILVGGIAEQLKRPLKWDPASERFPGDAEADRLRSVALRPPWRL